MLAVDDLLDISAVRDVRIAPRGGALAFSVISADSRADAQSSEVRVVEVDADERECMRIAGAASPSWSPDGRSLACTIAAADRAEVRIFSPLDGASRSLLRLSGSIRGLVFSPDGKRLALENVSSPSSGRRLGIVEVDSGRTAWVDHAEGEEDSGATWAPDGRNLAFGRAWPGSPNGEPASAIYETGIEAGAPRPIATGLEYAAHPSWSPDGTRLACIGAAGPCLGSADPNLQPWVLRFGAGAARPAATELSGVVIDPVPAGPVWTPDGSAILFRAAWRGDIRVTRASLENRETTALTTGSQVVDFSLSRDGEVIAFVDSSPQDPGSVRLLSSAGVRSLKSSCGAWTRRRGELVPEPTRRSFRSRSGGELDAWVLGLDRARSPQPLLLALHGGPHGFFGPGFLAGHFYRNVLAARGWIVLSLNAPGSGSYGREFAGAIRGRWGTLDLPEHLAAVDELVAAELADPRRLAVAGYSYGGYLAAYAVANDHRFRAAVVGAPIVDLESFERTSDIGAWYTPWEMNGGLPGNEALYRRLSPLSHAEEIKTPVLLLHGEDDRRCPVAQSKALADRLARPGGPEVRLVTYPGADHLFYAGGRPSSRLDFNRRIVDWVEAKTVAGSDG